MNPRTSCARLRDVLGAWNYQFPGTTKTATSGSRREQRRSNNAGERATTLAEPVPERTVDPSGNSLGALPRNRPDARRHRSEQEGAARAADFWRTSVPVDDTVARASGLRTHAATIWASAARMTPVVKHNQIGQRWPRASRRLNSPSRCRIVFGIARDAVQHGGHVARGQLLRPFPQFQNINVRQVRGTVALKRGHLKRTSE